MQKFTYTANINTDILCKIFSNTNDNITCDISELVFFDIETTGLSSRNSVCFLIGYAKVTDNHLICTQLFADTPSDEPLILTEFLSDIHDVSNLVTYNGNNFDIPFIETRCRQLSIPCCINNCKKTDIYSHMRRINHLLKLDSLKQKAVENFCGIQRNDTLSGGELIALYKDYIIAFKLKEDATDLLNILLLHNKEDVCALPDICSMLLYNNIINIDTSSCITFSSSEYTDDILRLTFTCDTNYPADISAAYSDIMMNVSGCTVIFSIPVYNTELKHFYKDYKNYFYLPNEDCAIHKSVAAYVDASRKQKASKENCYTKKSGAFIPYFCETKYPCFKKHFDDKSFYIQCNEKIYADKTFAYNYVKDIINLIAG